MLAAKALIFDAGGVLLHPNFDWISEQATTLDVEVSVAELHHGYYRAICAVDYDAAMQREGMALNSAGIRAFLLRHLLGGAGVDAEKVEAVVGPLARRMVERFPRESDIFHWSMPGVRAAIAALKQAGFALAVASNNDGALDAQLTQVGLFDLFEVRLDSGIEGVAKPDPELLWRAARAIGHRPEDCLYVGDIDRVDGAAARAAGMSFLLLDPLGQPRASSPQIVASLDQLATRVVLGG